MVNAVSAWHACIMDVAYMVETAWKEIRNYTIDVHVRSDVPVAPNEFNVTSSVLAPLMTEAQSRAHMAKVIRELIETN